MKKIYKDELVSLLFLFFFILLIPISLNAEQSQYKKIEGLTDAFYYKCFGSWDLKSQSNIEGENLGFSWGPGQFVRYISIVIDYNFLTNETPKDLLIQGEFGGYFIDKIDEIDHSIFKLTLRSKYDGSSGSIIIHSVNNTIWFETENQYNNSIGKSKVIAAEYGTRAFNNGEMFTGPNSLYIRRSGPPQ